MAGNRSCNSSISFKCLHSEGCIARSSVCDGIVECPDGSDESGCIAPNTTFAPFKPCVKKDYFRCRNEDQCIPYMLVCNGINDCDDNSDENLPQCWVYSSTRNMRVKATSVESTNASLEWSPYSTNTTGTGVHYIVSYVSKLHGSYSWQNRTNITSTRFTISHLHAALMYNITVYINQSATVLPPYHQLTITTADGLPDVPRKVHASILDASIVVTWFAPIIFNGTIQRYRVHIVNSTTPTPHSSPHYVDTPNGNTYATSIDLYTKDFRLQYTRSYTVWVTAFTSRGEGSRSEPQSIIFGENAITDHVRDIKAKAENHSIVLSWSAPANISVTNYTVVYYVWDVLHTTITKKTTFEADSLCSASQYNFTIAPNNEHGSGLRMSQSASTKGPVIEEVVNVTFDQFAPVSVNVSWSAPKGVGNKETYTVYYDYRPEDTHDTVIDDKASAVSAKKTWAVISDLRACEVYMFRIAVTGSGKCPLSRSYSIQTGQDRLAAPEDLEFKFVNKTCGNLTWHSSCEENFEPVNYIITKTDNATGESHLSSPFLPSNRMRLSEKFCRLLPGATYIFHVRNNVHGGRKSENLTVHIDPYDAPYDLFIYQMSQDGVDGRLQWQFNKKELKDKIPHFEVLMCHYKYGEDQCSKDENFTHFLTSNQNSVNYTGLAGGYIYAFKVRLNKTDGYYGSNSTVATIPVKGSSSGASAAAQDVTLSHTNLIAIIVSVSVVVLALVAVTGYIVMRHRRLQRSFRSFASSHYDSQSGLTTFTAADELGEDEDAPMIRGFSDDEPLVIA